MSTTSESLNEVLIPKTSVMTRPVELPFVIQPPLPGESAISHRERLTTYCMFPRFEPMIDYFRLMTTGKTHYRKRSDVNEIVAHLCGIPLSDYIDKHSLLPVYRLFLEPPFPRYTESSLFRSSCNDRASTKAFGNNVIRCSACDGEMLDQFGTIYLLRNHYFPGVDVCPRHGEPLRLFRGKMILNWRSDELPFEVIEPDSQLIAANSDPIFVRYREACTRVLDSSGRASQQRVSTFVLDSLHALRVTISGKNKWIDIAEFIWNNVPTAWTNKHLQLGGDIRITMQAMTLKRGFTALLLLSILCSNVGEMMEIIFDMPLPPETPQPSENDRLFDPLDTTY